jgi:hypothetical protein
MKDPQFLADAAKLDLEISPIGAGPIDAFLADLYRTPKDVVGPRRGRDPEVTGPSDGQVTVYGSQSGPVMRYSRLMQTGFEEALTSRVRRHARRPAPNAGACFSVCPDRRARRLWQAPIPKPWSPGVLDILRFGKGAAESREVGQGPAWRAASASRPADVRVIRASC